MNQHRHVFLLAVLISLLIGSNVWAEGPSFDCKAKQLGSAEKLICDDKELSELDRELSGVFAKAKVIDGNAVGGTLPAEQRGWIKGRNECWKDSDLRGCLVASYLRRIAELQIRYRLLSPDTTATYACENNPAHELIVSYFATNPRAVTAEHGDNTFYLFEDRKEHYQGRNEILTIKGEDVEFIPAFEAAPIFCRPQSPKKSRLDPTWDKDGDGINDCEGEGSCDHTVDYSKPRRSSHQH